MRPLKFRVWDKKRKVMLGSDYPQNWLLEEKDEWWGCVQMIEITTIESTAKNEKYELMQFTGLKDKNEKEIYEGDIVKIPNKIYNFEVIFNSGCFGILDRNSRLIPFWQVSPFEVIGNIYENPELINN